MEWLNVSTYFVLGWRGCSSAVIVSFSSWVGPTLPSSRRNRIVGQPLKFEITSVEDHSGAPRLAPGQKSSDRASWFAFSSLATLSCGRTVSAQPTEARERNSRTGRTEASIKWFPSPGSPFDFQLERRQWQRDRIWRPRKAISNPDGRRLKIP